MASPWTDWDWDGRGFWVSSRRSPLGVTEYKYEQYPTGPERGTHGALAEEYPNHTVPRSEWGHMQSAGSVDCNGASQNVHSTTPISFATDIFSPGTNSSSYTTCSATHINDSQALSGIHRMPVRERRDVPNGHTKGYVWQSCDPCHSPAPYTDDVPRSNFAPNNLSQPSEIQYRRTTPQGDSVKNISEQDISSQPSQIASPRTEIRLDSDYCVIKQPSRFFKVGRVFKMLWTEPARPVLSSSKSNESHFSKTWLDGDAFSEIRRFVVIREGKGYSLCLAIHTYNGRGTLKASLLAEEHAAIYPALQSAIVSRDEKMKVNPFPTVIETGKADDISPMSRINLRKIYTVEHYNRVLNIGRIDPAHIDRLEQSSTLGSPTPAILKGLAIAAASDPNSQATQEVTTTTPGLQYACGAESTSSEVNGTISELAGASKDIPRTESRNREQERLLDKSEDN